MRNIVALTVLILTTFFSYGQIEFRDAENGNYIFINISKLNGNESFTDGFEKAKNYDKAVFLCDSSINELPEFVYHMDWLHEIEIAGKNELNPNLKDTINSSFNRFNELLKLSIINLPISSFHEEVRLKKLRELEIHGSSLSDIPNEIFRLKRLKKLIITKSIISHIPIQIQKLKCLTTLNLASSDIQNLPMELFDLKRLTELYLDGTMVESLPREILKLKKLKKLSLLTMSGIVETEDLCNLKKLNEIHVLFTGGTPTCFNDSSLWSMEGLTYYKK